MGKWAAAHWGGFRGGLRFPPVFGGWEGDTICIFKSRVPVACFVQSPSRISLLLLLKPLHEKNHVFASGAVGIHP